MKSKKREAKPKKPSNGQAKAPGTTNVDKIVRKINEIAIDTVERGAMEIGETVLNDMYEGSLSEALSHNPNKGVTLQEVCEHPNLIVKVNRRTLGTWVKAAHLKKVLDAGKKADKVDCSKLRYSHYAALLKVTNDDKRRKLAKEAINGKWSARKLIDEIEGTKQKRVANGNGKKDNQGNDGKSQELIRMVENPLDLAAKEAAEKFAASMKSLLQVESGNRWDILKVIDSVLDKIGKSTNFLNKLKHSLISNNLDDLNPEQV